MSPLVATKDEGDCSGSTAQDADDAGIEAEQLIYGKWPNDSAFELRGYNVAGVPRE
jgi:hypothetical protein